MSSGVVARHRGPGKAHGQAAAVTGLQTKVTTLMPGVSCQNAGRASERNGNVDYEMMGPSSGKIMGACESKTWRRKQVGRASIFSHDEQSKH